MGTANGERTNGSQATYAEKASAAPAQADPKGAVSALSTGCRVSGQAAHDHVRVLPKWQTAVERAQSTLPVVVSEPDQAAVLPMQARARRCMTRR